MWIFAKQVFNLQLAFSATQHASGWLAVSAGTCGVFKECKFASVLLIAKQHNRRIREKGMYFLLELKINVWELYVMAPLDVALPWHLSVGWVIGCSRFNLYTQAHTDFRWENLHSNFQYVCTHCPDGAMLEWKEEKKRNGGGGVEQSRMQVDKFRRKEECDQQKQHPIETPTYELALGKSWEFSMLQFSCLMMYFINIQLPLRLQLKGTAGPSWMDASHPQNSIPRENLIAVSLPRCSGCSRSQ